VINFIQRAIARVQGAFSLPAQTPPPEPAPSPEPAEPKRRAGRKKKFATEEERRLADNERHAKYMRERRQREAEAAAAAAAAAEEARKKAARRSVGECITGWDTEGCRQARLVLAVDADGNITKYEEIALDANGNPRKWSNGHWVPLKEVVDDEPIVAPTPKPQSVTPPVQQSAPVIQPAAIPVKATPGPEPTDNADSCGAIWGSYHAALNWTLDRTQFFLVSRAFNLEQATKLGQLAVSVPYWHPDYNELFSSVAKIWILVTRTDGAWLRSLLTASPEVRAKMRLCVCDDIAMTLSLKFGTEIAVLRGEKSVRVDSFYERFQQMPQDAVEVATVLAPPPAPPVRALEVDAPFSGGGGYRTSGWGPALPPSDPSKNDGSGFCS